MALPRRDCCAWACTGAASVLPASACSHTSPGSTPCHAVTRRWQWPWDNCHISGHGVRYAQCFWNCFQLGCRPATRIPTPACFLPLRSVWLLPGEGRQGSLLECCCLSSVWCALCVGAAGRVAMSEHGAVSAMCEPSYCSPTPSAGIWVEGGCGLQIETWGQWGAPGSALFLCPHSYFPLPTLTPSRAQ